MECAPKHSIIKVATFSALMESLESCDRQRCSRGSHDPKLQERIQMSSCFDNYDDLELDPLLLKLILTVGCQSHVVTVCADETKLLLHVLSI